MYTLNDSEKEVKSFYVPCSKYCILAFCKYRLATKLGIQMCKYIHKNPEINRSFDIFFFPFNSHK